MGLPFGSAGASVDSGMQAGYLDFDSNSMCVIDGPGGEVIFLPRSQRTLHRARRHLLTVRRDHRRWRVSVFHQQTAPDPVFASFRTSTISNAFSHGQGAGVQALVFDN